MVKSNIFKLCTTKHIKYIKMYIHNLGYVEVLSENVINKVSLLYFPIELQHNLNYVYIYIYILLYILYILLYII